MFVVLCWIDTCDPVFVRNLKFKVLGDAVGVPRSIGFSVGGVQRSMGSMRWSSLLGVGVRCFVILAMLVKSKRVL